jgi:hypothetical protein
MRGKRGRDQSLQADSSGPRKKGVMVAFEDETWASLYPKVEAEWMPRGSTRGESSRRVTTGGGMHSSRSCGRRSTVSYSTRTGRGGAESSSKQHLSNIIQYGKRHAAKKIILFIDHAPCHKTKKVNRFIRAHPILKIRMLPKKEGSEPQPCREAGEQATQIGCLREQVIRPHR